MAEAISNTSPLYYLHQIGALSWLEHCFTNLWTTNAVLAELAAGAQQGCAVPNISAGSWIRIADPLQCPSEWLSLDLGRGELSALALALENPGRIVLLDDALARRIAQSAGLNVWGTLRVVLEGKKIGLTTRIAPIVDKLSAAGMWISPEVRQRILTLADEGASTAL